MMRPFSVDPRSGAVKAGVGILGLSLFTALGLVWFLFASRSQSPRQPASVLESRPEPMVLDRPRSVPLQFRAEDLPFVYQRGETGAAWPVEVTGGGVALLDYDGDGRLDIFLVQGGDPRPGSKSLNGDVLLRNLGGRRFQDVSAQVGLAPRAYGQGVTAADYDGDGDIDLYVTRYGRNTLWRNDRPQGRFTDVTQEAGLAVGSWSLGAAFADIDRDGDLDLYVANYFQFDPARAPFRRDPSTGAADYGLPRDFPGLPDVLFENQGGGRFRDITAHSGLKDQERGMGILAADLNRDGLVDFLVANDAESNAAWINQGQCRFVNLADSLGLAVNGEGMAEANMGIALGDTDGDELDDVVITHFFGEHTTLWRGLRDPGGALLYQDQTREAGLAVDTRPVTGWGITLGDFDQDGRLDLVQTNGHIRREPSQLYPYDNPPLVWRGEEHGRFLNVTASAGAYFQQRYMGRGMATGDLDGDGDLDLVVVHHHTPSVILWNEAPHQGRFLIVELEGRPPCQEAIGTIVTVQAGDRRQVRTLVGGGGYLSSNDRRLHFGLGDHEVVDRIEVRWPSGLVEVRSHIRAGSVLKWREGSAQDVSTAAPDQPAKAAAGRP